MSQTPKLNMSQQLNSFDAVIWMCFPCVADDECMKNT
jgi:hypothetical protein